MDCSNGNPGSQFVDEELRALTDTAEGFYFPESKGGTCWRRLVRYTRNIGNKGFTFPRINTDPFRPLIEPVFVARVS